MAGRVFRAPAVPEVRTTCGVSVPRALADASRFYYDLALSSSPPALAALAASGVPPGRVVFGSDHPYAPPVAAAAGELELAAWVAARAPGVATLFSPARLRASAVILLAKHAMENSVLPPQCDGGSSRALLPARHAVHMAYFVALFVGSRLLAGLQWLLAAA